MLPITSWHNLTTLLSPAKELLNQVFEIYYNGTTETNTHAGQWLPQTLGGTRQWAPNDAFVSLANDEQQGGNRNVLVAKDNQNRWYGNLYRSVTASATYVIRIAESYLLKSRSKSKTK
jgi:hypothetical protein